MGKKKSPKQRELEQSRGKRQPTPPKKKLSGVRILAVCDSPRISTGFSKVSQQLLTRFAREDAMIDIIGVNDMGGWYHPNEYPFRIYPAMPGASQGGDVYGRTVLQAALTGKHSELQPAWNLIWILNDHFILEQRMGGVFSEGTAWFINEALKKWRDDHDVTMKSMLYTPVDSVMKENWVTNGILPFDKAVSYTEFGKDEMKKAVKHELIDYIDKEIPVIPYGVELDIFKPEKKEDVEKFRKDTFGKDGWLKEHDFLLVSVNRNQPRKDMARTLEVFKQFNKKVPDSKLYIHAAAQDAGGNLLEMARCCGLDTDLLRCPTNWDAQRPYPVEYLNMIYNSADAVVSTHLGEGWGFCLHPDSRILTKQKWKKIKDVEIGDEVLNETGWSKVNNKMDRHFKGNLISIATQHGALSQPLLVTPEHKIRTKEGWVEAKDLKVKDEVLAVTSPLNYKDYKGQYRTKIDLAEFCPEIKWCRDEEKIWVYGKRFHSEMNRFIKWNKNTAELFGTYIAEGSRDKSGIVWAVGKHETEFTETIMRLIKETFNHHCYVEDGIDNGKRWIRLNSVTLKNVMPKLVGHKARAKTIAPLMHLIGQHTAQKLLNGMWKGDGSSEQYSMELTTCSEDLAYETLALARAIGYWPRIEHSIKRDSYRLRWHGDDMIRFRNALNLSTDGYKSARKSDAWGKVKEIKEVPYDGPVYDISVPDGTSFMTSHGVVHNSLTEGMSCERPVVFHNITSITEILGFDKQGESSGVPTSDTIDDYRGLGVGSNDFVCLGVGDLERMRPVASVDDFVDKLLWVYENEELALQMGKNGRKWLIDNNMDWDSIADIWIKEIIELLKVPKERTAIKEASEKVIEK